MCRDGGCRFSVVHDPETVKELGHVPVKGKYARAIICCRLRLSRLNRFYLLLESQQSYKILKAPHRGFCHLHRSCQASPSSTST